MVSGLASSVRAATESATFDLAGHDAAFVRALAQDAFAAPFELDEMIRLTFVVGGGKLSRQKYDPKSMQAFTSTLNQLGYAEDRGASCVAESAGCWKAQHDTGKNVKTVVVFPKLAEAAGNEGSKSSGGCDHVDEPLIPTNSPGWKVAVCSAPTFRNLLATYCPTFVEKRECVKCLEGLLQVEQAIEAKMMQGHPLDAGEQSFYDEASDLQEKHTYAQGEAAKHVEDGRLTLEEKRLLVEMNETRIQTLMREDNSAGVAKQLKKAMARKQQLQQFSDEALTAGAASYPPPLRHEAQIAALRKKLRPLRELEAQARGSLLTLGETRSLAAKEEIESNISQLEEASCGWFEEEDAFQARVQKSRDRFEAKHSGSKRGGKGGTRPAGNAASAGKGAGSAKWILPGEKPKNAWGSAGKKKSKAKGGAVFTAMMMDSSSDEEESEDEEETERSLDATSDATTKAKQHPAAANILTPQKAQSAPAKSGDNADDAIVATQQSKAKKGKRKKKKKGAPAAHQTAELTQSLSKKESPSSLSSSLLEFWRSLLLPLISAILSLLISLVTSMFAGKGSMKSGKKKKRG
ncbi:hypothetical protein ACHAXT_010759 [Thalassiosira profunda]